MSDNVGEFEHDRVGLHPGMQIYRLPPDTKWLIVDHNDGEYAGSELAELLRGTAVLLVVEDEGGTSLYLNFPRLNAAVRSPVVDGIAERAGIKR